MVEMFFAGSRHENHVFAVPRPHRMVRVQRIVGDLDQARAVAADNEYRIMPVRTATVGFERDAPPIRRPYRCPALHGRVFQRRHAICGPYPNRVFVLVIALAGIFLAGKNDSVPVG